MIQVWKIDQDGYLIETRLINETEKKENDVTIGFNQGFIKPRWNGVTWVEGATKEEQEKYKQSEENTRNNSSIEQRISDLEIIISEILGGSDNAI